MASDPIPAEPRFPLGDAAGLLEYRRTATGMKPIAPARSFGPVGHTYIVITCSLRGAGGGGGVGVGGGTTLIGYPSGANGVALPRLRDPWVPFEDYHPPTADLITVALMAFGIFLGLAAFVAVLLTITNGWTS